MQSIVISQISPDGGDKRAIALPGDETKASSPGSAVSTEASDVVLLPVRFWADSRVFEIAERPDHLDKEQWFRLLCLRAGHNYQARAGGRGFFRLTRAELESLKVRNPN